MRLTLVFPRIQDGYKRRKEWFYHSMIPGFILIPLYKSSNSVNRGSVFTCWYKSHISLRRALLSTSSATFATSATTTTSVDLSNFAHFRNFKHFHDNFPYRFPCTSDFPRRRLTHLTRPPQIFNSGLSELLNFNSTDKDSCIKDEHATVLLGRVSVR
jgi:hypothetical protein